MRRSFRFVSVAGLFAALAVAGCQERDRGGQAGAEVRKGGEGAAVQQPGTPPAAGQQQAQPAPEPIRDLTIVLVTPDRPTLFNRQVDLVGAQVQKVSNDRVFWVGPSAERTVPVYLDDQARSALLQGQHKLQKGDQVALVGEIRQSPSTQLAQQQWGLSSQEANELTGAQAYLHVTRILIGEKPGVQGGQQQGTQGGQQ
ncbi:hypothetical protein [Polyangium jinanense]|uniref:Lipoprotein n=1 Tax=Polyangium jinanense TaxID=2829994 RepID=A0A9X4AYZ3_9BACT|nr:hypothetical protein [Polyangium jinanense]MDC3959173.1 hypothetical protein [Polyangium jinanense]MDC3987607.1 hypothetical protein [Polyangium jinanense]